MSAPTHEFLGLQSALAGEYSLQRELGRGGMGVVYLARDVQLDRDVAIKVLPAELAVDVVARERFVREARMAAGLSHPHIVPIHRVGEADGYVFFVMSFIDGETLGERIRSRGPLPPTDAVRIMREVAWALAYAHGRGIIHRDVKPDNILLESRSGRAIVTDFGIAHGGDADLESAGKVMGTAHFMSPEQAAGGAMDGRSDIYSLGVVGYVAVSGKLPFDVPHLHALLLKQATEDAPSVAQAAPGLPQALAAAIDRCLARDPAQRFGDGEALADALAPLPEARPALPNTLRAWLAASNPLTVPYLAWSGLFSFLTAMNVYALLLGQRGGQSWDILLLVAAAIGPLAPIVGYHLNQARKQFQAGHTLADLRTALSVEEKERTEHEASVRVPVTPPSHRILRIATGVAAGATVTMFALFASGLLHERDLGGTLIFWVPFGLVGTTLTLGAVSNSLDVQFIPKRLKQWWDTGIRGRLWKSKLGEWIAKRLGAPERSKLAGANAFRATEAALGVAAGELYAALPKAYREQLAELPAIVESMEARAAEARAEIEMLAAIAPGEGADAAMLAARKGAASKRLGESVAALEGIRLDLLRLHAGAQDLQPITTLMDAAKVLGDDVARLEAAKREVDESLER